MYCLVNNWKTLAQMWKQNFATIHQQFSIWYLWNVLRSMFPEKNVIRFIYLPRFPQISGMKSRKCSLRVPGLVFLYTNLKISKAAIGWACSIEWNDMEPLFYFRNWRISSFMKVQISGAKTVAASIPIQHVSINGYILSGVLDGVNFSLAIEDQFDNSNQPHP